MKVKIFLTYIFLSVYVFGQNSASGNLSSFVDSLISNMPDDQVANQDKYQSPTAGNRTTWASIVTDIINGDYSTAHTNAGTIGYQVLQYTDTSVNPNKDYYILLKTSVSTNYWGSYFFNQNADRQSLVIHSPHPKYDTYTGAQGFYIFKNVGARAFFLSGTHRCNSTSYSACDGTTTVCSGSSESFKISDQPHTVDGMFQQTTITLDGLISDMISIQVHGFSKGVGDPDAILSNGTQYTPSGTDYVVALKNNLLTEDNTLTFKIAHIDTTWTELTATTNTQGRYINGSGDPCDIKPNSTTGRFIHIEQKKDGLRNPSINWDKLKNAIANTFAVDPLPVKLSHFTADILGNAVRLKWRTETEINNYGFEIQRAIIAPPDGQWGEEGGFEKIAFVQGYGNSSSPKEYFYADNSFGYGNIFYRLKQIDLNGLFEYSNTVNVYYPGKPEYKLFQNYPNPFNPETVISYRLPVAGKVSLKVYDILGNLVSILVDEYKQPGYYSVVFNRQLTTDNRLLSSGIYLYKLSTNNWTEQKKFILIK